MSDTTVNRYLNAIRARLAWRRDSEDLVAEMEDHLGSSIARFEATGMSAVEAVELTLARFGDPDEVADSFSRSPNGGLAVPTNFTRTGGILAITAAVLWVVVIAVWWVAGLTKDGYGLSGTTAEVSYGIGALALLLAGPLTLLSLIALNQRNGGLGAIGMVGTCLYGVAAAGGLAAWVMVGWGPFAMAGMLLFGSAMSRRDVAPRGSTLALTASLAVGGIVWLLAHLVGRVSIGLGFWGDDWLQNELGLTSGVSLLALALFRLGRWLRAEEPAPAELTGRSATT